VVQFVGIESDLWGLELSATELHTDKQPVARKLW